MKRVFSTTLLLVIGATLALTAQPGRRQPTPNDTLTAFTINPDRSATFRIYAPQAHTVSLGGDISGQPAVKALNGVWSITTAPNIAMSAYRYFFIVDGVRVNDPKNPMTADFRPMVDIVPAGINLFWQERNVPHGAMSIVHYHSEVTRSTRRLFVWTPPGYFAGIDKLPVLYLLHGGGDNDTNWPGQGKAGWILDNLIADKKITPMIVVMPDGSIPVATFAQDLGEVIIPYIEANFRAHTDTPHRAIAGLSMGGLETLEALLRYPDKFAYANVMSSGWFTNDPQAMAANEKRIYQVAPKLRANLKYFRFTDGGSTDTATPNTHATRDLFTRNGVSSEISEMEGGHTMYVWRYDLHYFVQEIFK